jgi:Iap family predicted aminopeptidase
MAGKHTPGPWTAEHATATRWPRVKAGDRVIANGVAGFANARLMAAAPDLLDALREMLDAQVCGPCALCDKARAAIAKAEGR